jgi:hypothetical protein
MLFNESDRSAKNTLKLRSGKTAERWDAETGHVEKIAGDASQIAVELKPYETAFYVMKD